MQFHSTNKESEEVSFEEALVKGLAPDGGLYMPDKIPKVSKEEIENLRGKEYWEIAYFVLDKFLDIDNDKLKELCKNAYNYSIPIEDFEEDLKIMRMDQGPTASFKDFAMRIMARLMDYFSNEELLILTATSGDTGGACADAFYGLDNIKVIILMPDKEISDRQRKQMTTLGDNIFPVTINGKFDDCQALVKKAFSDSSLDMNLTSANSINVGRLIPQAAYYFYGYSKGAENFIVPSGNWGNQTGGLIAKRMGLPIKKFVSSVNENDETCKFIMTGEYNKLEPSINCLSSAMNVGHPSNFSRVIELYGGQMDEKGNIIKEPDLEEMREDMIVRSVSDDETRDGIKGALEKGAILEPHGAVGYMAYKEVKDKLEGESLLLETAHPAKFPKILREFGAEIEVPETLKVLDEKEESYKNMDPDYRKIREYIKEVSEK
mgnify:CR=1 FL=1